MPQRDDQRRNSPRIYHTHRCQAYNNAFPHDLGAKRELQSKLEADGYRRCKRCALYFYDDLESRIGPLGFGWI